MLSDEIKGHSQIGSHIHQYDDRAGDLEDQMGMLAEAETRSFMEAHLTDLMF